MAYVDLNPIRAGISKTPEESEFTSIYDRIKRIRNPESQNIVRIPLRRFVDEEKGRSAIPYSLRDYLLLVDWSGRSIRAGKRGFIAAHAPPILKRLNIDAEAWEVLMTRRRTFRSCDGQGRCDAAARCEPWAIVGAGRARCGATLLRLVRHPSSRGDAIESTHVTDSKFFGCSRLRSLAWAV
jgi:hypothetical protein